MNRNNERQRFTAVIINNKERFLCPYCNIRTSTHSHVWRHIPDTHPVFPPPPAADPPTVIPPPAAPATIPPATTSTSIPHAPTDVSSSRLPSFQSSFRHHPHQSPFVPISGQNPLTSMDLDLISQDSSTPTSFLSPPPPTSDPSSRPQSVTFLGYVPTSRRANTGRPDETRLPQQCDLCPRKFLFAESL